MKKPFFIVLSFFALSWSITSCNKDNLRTTSDESEAVMEDVSAMMAIDESLDEEIDLVLEEFTEDGVNDRSSCPTVTSSAPLGTFPNTITFDYGVGCIARNGRTLRGQIVVEISDEMSNPGAVKTFTLVDFAVDGAEIEGTRTVENNGLNQDGAPCFSRNTDISTSFPNGSTASFQGAHTLCLIGGSDTRRVLDDVFSIIGGSNGLNRKGVAYSTAITEPLIKPRNCHYIVRGEIEVTHDDKTASLDFGNGFCDRIASLTLADGTVRNFLLDPWWRR